MWSGYHITVRVEITLQQQQLAKGPQKGFHIAVSDEITAQQEMANKSVNLWKKCQMTTFQPALQLTGAPVAKDFINWISGLL